MFYNVKHFWCLSRVYCRYTFLRAQRHSKPLLSQPIKVNNLVALFIPAHIYMYNKNIPDFIYIQAQGKVNFHRVVFHSMMSHAHYLHNVAHLMISTLFKFKINAVLRSLCYFSVCIFGFFF